MKKSIIAHVIATVVMVTTVTALILAGPPEITNINTQKSIGAHTNL